MQVTTEDGYILSMQRIPKGRSGKTADKPPVLLQHGLLMVDLNIFLSAFFLPETTMFINLQSSFVDFLIQKAAHKSNYIVTGWNNMAVEFSK